MNPLKRQTRHSIRWVHRPAALSMLAVALMATTACGGGSIDSSSTPASQSETTAAATSATASASASPAAQPKKPQGKSKEAKQLEEEGILLGPEVVVEDGSYPSYEVEKGSKLANYNPSLQTGEAPEGWSKSDLETGQLKAANFLLNTVLNNETRTSYYSNIQRLEKTFGKEIAPEYLDEFIENIQSNDDTPLMKDIFESPNDQYHDYTLINDGQTPRIKNVKAKVTSSEQWNGDNYYLFKGSYTLSAMNKKTQKPRDIDSKFEYGITVTKSGNGKQYISGTNNITGLYEDIS